MRKIAGREGVETLLDSLSYDASSIVQRRNRAIDCGVEEEMALRSRILARTSLRTARDTKTSGTKLRWGHICKGEGSLISQLAHYSRIQGYEVSLNETPFFFAMHMVCETGKGLAGTVRPIRSMLAAMV